MKKTYSEKYYTDLYTSACLALLYTSLKYFVNLHFRYTFVNKDESVLKYNVSLRICALYRHSNTSYRTFRSGSSSIIHFLHTIYEYMYIHIVSHSTKYTFYINLYFLQISIYNLYILKIYL